MVLPEPFATKNMNTKQEHLNIRKLWFVFVLEENATLESIFYDKLPNIMPVLGCKKEKRRNFHHAVIFPKIIINN